MTLHEKAGAKASSEEIVQILEDDILNGRLPPGTKLDEQALANRFNVSRTPVREAIRELSANNLVEVRRNLGATVKTLTAAEVIDMFLVLAELEGLAARLCARRMSIEEIEEARACNRACAEAAANNDYAGFLAANAELHALIQRGARSQFLATEAAKLGKRLAGYRRAITHPRQMASSLDVHERILSAISAGDEAAAQSAMRAHVDVIAGSAADIVMALGNAPTAKRDIG
ncbi:GntR family transcriptional regulator [Xinfangfangia pollutisoli]|uniref:GntR family transcriptional regulator n=1 Tax=Xinfangfangia pollutisoli TaxID=2865960 RepID=UPI001CD81467|nr:GntR family transcriptional regulator [Xinfangfangia pollutisoli]